MNEINDKDFLKEIYKKLEVLENKIDNYENLLKDSKNFIGFSIDTIDSLADRNKEKVDKLLILADKLLKNELIDSFIILLEKLEKLSTFLKNDSKFIEFIFDSIDSIAKKSEENGLELSSVLEELFFILKKLLDKNTITLLNNLLDRSSVLDEYIKNIDYIPNTFSMIIDTIDHYANKINNNEKLSVLKDKLKEISTNEENISIIKILKLLNDKDIKNKIYLLLSLVKNIDYSFKEIK